MYCNSGWQRILMVLALFFCVREINAQTLFTYGNKAVTKQEFIKAYEKNAPDEAASEKTYREYLELYTRYKLKVQAARDLKLDTLSSQHTELQAFRNQVADSYMNDEASLNTLVDEAYERSRKDIRLGHIYIPVPAQSSASQVADAEKTIQRAYQQLAEGKGFADVAMEFSKDPAVSKNKGDLGYITAFVLPYEIENVVYAISVNQVSKPVKTNLGFHIFKNLGERPSMGRMRVAQILLAFPPDLNDSIKAALKQRADSIYTEIKNGRDFAQLARQFSSDNISYERGGEMEELSVGRYDPLFETTAFALQNDGDVSQPIETSFGYHIIRRIARRPAPIDNNDAEWRNQIKAQVQSDDRIQVSNSILLKKIKQVTGYKKLPYSERSLKTFTDSLLVGGASPKLKDLSLRTPLFVVGDTKLLVRDWQSYLQTGIVQDTPVNFNLLFNAFTDQQVLSHYRDNLEKYSAEFREQLREFKEGNLLFEVMQRKVWDPAASDSVGLRKYYDEHKNKYWWEASADAILFTAASEEIAEDIREKLRTGTSNWRNLVDSNANVLQADSGRFELGQIPVVDRTNFTEALITANVKNENERSVSFAYIIKLYKDREPRSFGDARGFVINDYQTVLEEKWMAELKRKYPVKVNEEVFKALLR